MRGHRGHAQARAELGRDAVRQRHRLPVGTTVHCAAVPHLTPGRRQPGPDPLADPALVDAVADRVDHAGAVVVRDLEAVDRPRASGPLRDFQSVGLTPE